jgi:hypothetical protein
MTRARKNPAPESIANNGLTCPLVPLVVKGRVAGGGGSLLPMAAIVVEVVDVVATVRGGRVTNGKVTAGRVTGDLVTGDLVVVDVARCVVGVDCPVVGGVDIPTVVVEPWRWACVTAAAGLRENGPAIPKVRSVATASARKALTAFTTLPAMAPVCSLPRRECRTAVEITRTGEVAGR